MFRSIHNSIFHSCRSNHYITAKQHSVAAPSRRVPYSHAHLEGSKNRWLMRLARDFRLLAI